MIDGRETTVRLAGARSDSLLGYLRGIAAFRLISTQLDSNVRASWENGSLVLHGISQNRVLRFFMDEYAPTPVLNPWNSGAGFDAKSRVHEAGKALDRLDAQSAQRWHPYREALRVGRSVIGDIEDLDAKDVKARIVSRLRATLSDRAIEWVDAAVLIGKDNLGFPIILGTGGNDGRLDFSINFLRRVLDVIGDRRLETSEALLLDALKGTSTVPLPAGILGQYQLGSGSYNNPWDLMFAIEGAIAFAGSITRRFNSDGDRPAAPFQFSSMAAGYAAASDQEEDRGEIWLPQWRGSATYPSLRSVLRNGRVALVSPQAGSTREARVLGASSAADSIAAIQAAQTLGVTSGISSFSRIVIAQRNGLAFGATFAGQIEVADRPEVAALARDVRSWVLRVSRLDQLGAAARNALREYQEGIVAYAARPSRDAFLSMLASLADLDDAMAFARNKELKPLPWIGSQLHRDLDELHGEAMLEDRIARALASVGSRNRAHRLRYRISRVTFDNRKNIDTYDPTTKSVWRIDVRETATIMFARAVRESSIGPIDEEMGFAAHFYGSRGLRLNDFGRLIAGEVDWQKLRVRLRAYSIIEPYPRLAKASLIRYDERAQGELHVPTFVPVAFAALKTLVHGNLPRIDDAVASSDHSHATFMDAETAIQLTDRANGNALRSRALSGAYARLRSAGADIRDFRAATIDADSVGAYAVALLTPAGRKTREALWKRCQLNHDDDRTLSQANTFHKELQ